MYFLTTEEIKQLRHHVATYRVVASYSCNLIEQMLSETETFSDEEIELIRQHRASKKPL